MTFAIIVLVCAASMSPPSCQPATAAQTIAAGEASNEIACMKAAQIAQAARAPLPAGYYLKVMCQRTSIGPTTG